jgi:hypothetical protein
MLKAIGHLNGRKTFMLGFSFKNLDRFRAEPGETFIKIKGEEIGLPHDIIIFSGETEAHLAELVKNSITPDTIVHVDPKLKS